MGKPTHKLKSERVEVPEWDMAVVLRQPSYGLVSELTDRMQNGLIGTSQAAARLVEACTFEEDGTTRLFGPNELDSWPPAEASGVPMRLARIINKLAGVEGLEAAKDGAIEDLKKTD